VKKNRFYTRFDLPTKDFSTQLDPISMTRQSEADSVDINKIMERFDRTGQLPVTMSAPPRYGDARVVDFQTAKQIVLDAEASFKQLPAEARQYFGHDPQNLLNALADSSEDTQKRLLKLGVIVERQETPEQTLQRIASNTEKHPEKAAQ